ncbi:SpoIVB peptidase [Clostridium beijerinckii]|jgi:SpoIVB peptidase. Serine peptidase. MEROPS family S55|uniref:SpoIVB peptidase n=2 Tax=Clostridium beijerinckii TaxID=1520 RepID=A0AAE2V3T0_CLOBE|nr:SpoIVB peptidase [Clostridium beijerinckii]ABR33883.1 Peptidase S55, sporulation stage IV, protein B [Clostridium beijerinckii NCIMB 8052]AIU04486.1 peptidase S55, sporulation stage IV, protein B [Clostridium beijerinckii ATCC 35702]MBF7811511.1 SpoIVB peptidase [Clostridium beijerinckii]NRT24826.1 stage IV sporulation protein B [Clostridium beijerinckii]NRT67582.1 stage IV sporulation protein B [Clostridium beijerinckii]
MKRKILCATSLIMTPILILILFTTMSIRKLPSKIYTRDEKTVQSIAPIGNTISKIGNNDNEYEIKFLGMIPLKAVEVQKIKDLEICPGGNPVGVRVNSEGVIIVGYSEIEINNKKEESPGKAAGLEIGDVILRVNGENMENSMDLLKTIKECDNESIKVDILRNDENLTKTIHLKKENNKDYKIGLWIRDSTAGVGTMTFFDPTTKKFGALGHPITDADTNEPFLVKKGDLLESSIISVRKGEKGSPGELKGIFLNEETPTGNIEKNTQSGIFGEIKNTQVLNNKIKPLKVGFRDEISVGKAKIITTVDESGPQEFDIEIEKTLNQSIPGSKSMVIKITDPRLLQKTGGIVQGMSGSPIIQNDKIVGAVTHVLINKPDTGYGIYIEWMLQEAGIIK